MRGAAGVGKTSLAHQFLTSDNVDYDDDIFFFGVDYHDNESSVVLCENDEDNEW